MNMIARTSAIIAALLIITTTVAAQPKKFFGTIWQRWEDTSAVPRSFSQLFSQVTPEGSGKWGPAEPARDNMVWGNLDAMFNYAEAHNLLVKEHCFFWGQSAPNWIGGLSNAEQKAEAGEWVGSFLSRYGAKIDMIDVINENSSPVIGAFGGGGSTGYDWYINSFQLVRDSCARYCPNAKLILNDDWLSADDQATTDYIRIANLLKARNLIDGIGDQCHYYENSDSALVHRNLDRLAATGLPIYISELDFVGDDQTQLGYYRKFFPLFWDHPAVKGITLWGYQEGHMWRDGHIMNADGTWHPALTFIVDYMAKHGGATGTITPRAVNPIHGAQRIRLSNRGLTIVKGSGESARKFDIRGCAVNARCSGLR